jgi:uncharacterized membrane protein (UPF0127 family)
MRFPINVVYLDHKHCVRNVAQRNQLGSMAGMQCLRARSVLELPAGIADESQTQPGDQLIFDRTLKEATGSHNESVRH